MVVTTTSSMAIRLKRAVIVIFGFVNCFMFFALLQVVDKQTIKSYSVDLIQNKLNRYVFHAPTSAPLDAADKVRLPLNSALVWGKIDNLHKALPAYEKMRAVYSNLRDYRPVFLRKASSARISRDMLRYKSIMNEGNVDRLREIFSDVLHTNRSIKIGIVGGTYSSEKIYCKKESCLYFDVVVRWLQQIIGVDVVVHNAALRYATSDYFAWCLSPHLDALDMDIIIWELATEDYIMRDTFGKTGFDNPARPQEELTRQILTLSNKPFLMYFGLLSSRSVRHRECVNSEYFAGRHLSKYYNVTVISWATAVCSRLWRTGFTPIDLVYTDNQLSPFAHSQGALFIINYMRNILETVSLDEMNKTQSDERHINKLIAKHDAFLKNSKSNAPARHHRVQRDLSPTNNSTKGSQSTLNSTMVKSGVVRQHLPKPKFCGNLLKYPLCWPASNPQFEPKHKLTFSINDGWEPDFSERENWFTSTEPNQQISFPISVGLSPDNLTTTIAITMITCTYCGQALVWLDNHFEGANLVNSYGNDHMMVVRPVLYGVTPGDHVVRIKNMEEKPFKLAAIMTTYEHNMTANYCVGRWW